MQESQRTLKHAEIEIYKLLHSGKSADGSASREWGQKVNDLWSELQNLELGLPVESHKDKDKELIKFYEERIKPLKPELTVGKDKGLVVTGLDSLKD